MKQKLQESLEGAQRRKRKELHSGTVVATLNTVSRFLVLLAVLKLSKAVRPKAGQSCVVARCAHTYIQAFYRHTHQTHRHTHIYPHTHIHR